MVDALRRLAVPVVIVAIEIALQIGGYHNEPLAWGLAIFALAYLLLAVVTWPPIAQPVGKQIGRIPIRIVLRGSLGAEPETPGRVQPNGFEESGIWWEFDGLLLAGLGRYEPSVQPRCPDHHSYTLQLQRMYAAGSRGEIVRLHRSHRPVIREGYSMGADGWMVCANGPHDICMAEGTDSLANAWTRAEAKIEAKIRAMQEEAEGRA